MFRSLCCAANLADFSLSVILLYYSKWRQNEWFGLRRCSCFLYLHSMDCENLCGLCSFVMRACRHVRTMCVPTCPPIRTTASSAERSVSPGTSRWVSLFFSWARSACHHACYVCILCFCFSFFFFFMYVFCVFVVFSFMYVFCVFVVFSFMYVFCVLVFVVVLSCSPYSSPCKIKTHKTCEDVLNFWWSLCTLYLHTCWVTITVGDSGLCVTSFDG